jgi:uncharacterized protein YbaR (Trm112 family)
MDVEKHVPKIENGYADVFIHIEICPVCRKPMIDVPRGKLNNTWLSELFDHYYQANLTAQMKRAGIICRGEVKDKDDNYICEECEAAGKSSFVCSLCKQEYPSSDKQESFGDPPEYLCKYCYETVPAKVWKDKRQQLEGAHRWDSE